MSEEEKVVVEEPPVVNDEVDDSKSTISDAADKLSTSTYKTAQSEEESTTPQKNDVVNEETPESAEIPAVPESEDNFNDHEDEDGHLSDDQKSNSSLNGSDGSPLPDTEREEGDGQEEGDKKDKKLDHDEDRRDPQYIPKRGVFYEHDDRTLDEETEEKKEPAREPKKNKPFEAVERWGHDMYNEDEQSPKTTDELIDAYGYDIRKEESPPKARRRRRYGKGPNKYERSWEDEQAYNKTPTRGGGFKGQKRPPWNIKREEDFPALGPKSDVSAGVAGGDATPAPQRNDSARPEVKSTPKPPSKDEIIPSKEETKHFSKGPINERTEGGRPSRSENTRGRAAMPRRGRTGHEPSAPFSNKNHHGAPDKKGHSTADEDIATLAQYFSHAVINVDRNIAPIRSTSEPPSEDRPPRESKREDGGKHSNHPSHHKHGGDRHHGEKHHSGAPQVDKHHQPMDQPSTKSKRYSTQRQRPAQQMNNSVGQTGAPPPPPTTTAPGYLPPQQGYYPPQHGMCPPEGTPHMSAPPPGQFPPPPGGMQMVAFLPGVPPPPTNTFHPPPNVYVPPAPYIPPPPIVQPPPAEVYQGGVTYYNTQSQVMTQIPRAAPSRRVKLAIPIVSPDNSQPIQ